MRDRAAVPVSPLVLSVILIEEQVFYIAQVSEGAEDSSHSFGGAGIPLGGEHSGTREVRAVAVRMMQRSKCWGGHAASWCAGGCGWRAAVSQERA